MIPAVGTGATVAAIAGAATAAISNPKGVLNKVGLRTRSLENAVTGKSVKSTAINKFFTSGNKEEEAISLGIKVQAQEDSAREIGFVGTLKVLQEVIKELIAHHDAAMRRTVEETENEKSKGAWITKFKKLSKRKKELIYIIVYKVFPSVTRTVLPDFIRLFKLRQHPQNYTQVFYDFTYPYGEEDTIPSLLFQRQLIGSFIKRAEAKRVADEAVTEVKRRQRRADEEVHNRYAPPRLLAGRLVPGGSGYAETANRFKKMKLQLAPMTPERGRRRRRKERRALRQKEEKERKKIKNKAFTKEEEKSAWFQNATRRGGRKTRKGRKTRRRKRRRRQRRKGRKTRRKTHK